MYSPSESEAKNSHKRSFTYMNSDQTDLGLRNDHEDHAAVADSKGAKIFNPRKYQSQVFQVAMKRNTIAVLETGTGKTMIAVMLIKEIGQAVKSSGEKKLIVFLAPTVHLVNQQHEVIKIHTSFEVGEYYGAKGVDEWTLKCWEKEINDHDVLVMTPQILLDALRKAFLSLDMVCLLIIDECHRASGNHPYARIMKEFYHKSNSKPKIFGMTASPVARKVLLETTFNGTLAVELGQLSVNCFKLHPFFNEGSVYSCNGNSEGQISELESNLDSQIYTVEDRTEMQIYVHSAKERIIFYHQAHFCSLDIKAKIESLLSKFDASLLTLQNSAQISYKDIVDKFKTLQQRLQNVGAKILHCLEDLGPVCAFEAVKVCLENTPNTIEECEVFRESSLKHKLFLEEVLRIIGECLPVGHENFLDFDFDYLKAVEVGYVSQKLHELIQLFLSFGGASEVLCLIFVERIITAKVIQRFVKRVSKLAHFTVSYLTGSNTSVDALAPKIQKETLDSFRSGKINLLFATDVVEEGIDVPNCSCVVRFDLPKTVRSYVQSRGRARQDKSQFIIMLESENMKQRNQLYDIIKSEHLMIDTALDRDPDACVLKACCLEEKNVYSVEATGASATADSSVSLLHQYCQKLPGDKYCTPKPSFECIHSGSSYECKITLPANAAFQTVVGPTSGNYRIAKQLACLEACKKLHQMGALDDHLLPSIKEPFDSCPVAKGKGTVAGAGTTKRKELHGTTLIHALTGSWGGSIDGFKFHAYKFEFSCNIVTKLYSGFVLLMESKLDNDVGNIEMDLYLVGKMVKATVSSCGQVCLDAEQMIKARCFQEFFFNGLFGRLFLGSKSTGTQRLLFLTETDILWGPRCMYFLLPIETLDISSQEPWKIRWGGINACTSVVEFLKTNSMLTSKHCNIDKGNMSPAEAWSSETESKDADLIQFANSSVDVANLRNMVVLAFHTGRIYSIVEMVDNSSAESPFDGTTDAVTSEFTSFAEYFRKKYGIVLMHPGQPLLRLKQSHNPHNLLVDFDAEGSSGVASQAGKVKKKPQMHVHMPPELLVHVNVPIDVLNSFYLLPSLMQRLESLMLASQLREEINCCLSNFHIPCSLILEAITTRRCCESFSMERLELLGDSVLKYSMSCNLFLRYPQKQEGQLSDQRSNAVCNANLHKLGTDRKLQGYIRDSAFDPRRWVAPGQHSVRPVPCKCGWDSLEVPLDANFQTEDPKVVLGKCCDMGHRWMVSKTIADCVEALIGAYYISGGLVAALHVMKWLGLDAEPNPSLLMDVINSASIRTYVPRGDEIDSIESKTGYKFTVKFLLQEAITHPSSSLEFSYERLEFLGDSILDLLITTHLYQSHTEIDQGELTDLRSAFVNNESFARVAVRRNLYKHLHHSSTSLLSEITEYVKSFPEPLDDTTLAPSKRGPKALGDLVESIAGAVLIDTKLNIDEVWRIFKPLLSPIVTPDKLELPPLRELIELCDSLGYFMKEKCTNKGETVHVELRLQLENVLLIGEGCDHNRKQARGQAASNLLKDLEKRGISRGVSKSREPDQLGDSSSMDLDINVCNQTTVKDLPEPMVHKKKSVDEINPPSPSNDCSMKACSTDVDTLVIASINMKKGGPRTTLTEICKKMLWPMPKFETDEQKSRTPMEFGEGAEKRKGFNSYVSKIILHIPNFGTMEETGEARADKKSSFDSAAVMMLYKLQQDGKLIIGDSK